MGGESGGRTGTGHGVTETDLAFIFHYFWPYRIASQRNPAFMQNIIRAFKICKLIIGEATATVFFSVYSPRVDHHHL